MPLIITIKIDTGNAAFHDDDRADEDRTEDDDEDNTARDAEVARILRAWAARIPEDGYGARLMDYNGNRVGSVTLEEQ